MAGGLQSGKNSNMKKRFEIKKEGLLIDESEEKEQSILLAQSQSKVQQESSGLSKINFNAAGQEFNSDP